MTMMIDDMLLNGFMRWPALYLRVFGDSSYDAAGLASCVLRVFGDSSNDDAGLASSFSHDLNVNVPYLKLRNGRKIEAHCIYYIATTWDETAHATL